MAFSMTAMVGAEFPLFALSHCRDVVVAVSRAGGFGVLGGALFSLEELEQNLAWIDAHVDGKPYGIDVLIPEHTAVETTATPADIAALIPPEYRAFVLDLLQRNGVKATAETVRRSSVSEYMLGEQLLDVAVRHPVRLMANALGIAPPMMIEKGRKHGIPVAALVGAKEHAIRQAKAGVDIIVAQGTEAGGHCGEVSTLVVVPEVIQALKPFGNIPVLAAGGIMTGRQMAGMMAMGAAGAWTGSVWLATPEAETSPVFREKMLAASSRDTVRSKFRTGKPSRQLRSSWHDAWEAGGAPPALPLPLMGEIAEPAFALINKAAEAGQPQARELVSYFVGQGVGLVTQIKSSAAVVQEFKEDFAEAIGTVMAFAD